MAHGPRADGSPPGLLFCLCNFRRMSRTFLYRCPNPGRTVQGWSAEEVTDDETAYEAVACLICTQTHLVNMKTGKVLGGEEDERRRLDPGAVSIWVNRLYRDRTRFALERT